MLNKAGQRSNISTLKMLFKKYWIGHNHVSGSASYCLISTTLFNDQRTRSDFGRIQVPVKESE